MYVLTLTGAAQQLSTVLPAVVAPARAGAYDFPCTYLTLQPGGANASPIYVGSSSLVTSSLYGFRLEASDGGVPTAPFVFDIPVGNIKLSELWVSGAAGETLHLLLVSV